MNATLHVKDRHALDTYSQRRLETALWLKRLRFAVLQDRNLLNEFLANGEQEFRIQFLRTYKDQHLLLVDEHDAKAMWAYFRLVKHRQWPRSKMDPVTIAQIELEHTRIDKPPTMKDIILGLEIDDNSRQNDDMRRLFYGRDGSCQRELEELKGQTLLEMGL